MGDQEYELMMQALVTLVREFTNVYERLRAFASVYERLRVLTSVYERLRENFLKVSINYWTIDVRAADGVTGAGHECAAEEKGELVSLAMVCAFFT